MRRNFCQAISLATVRWNENTIFIWCKGKHDSIWVCVVEDDIFFWKKTVLIVCLAVLGCKQLSVNCSKHIDSYFDGIAEAKCI